MSNSSDKRHAEPNHGTDEDSDLPENEVVSDDVLDGFVRPGISIQLVACEFGVVLDIDHQRLALLQERKRRSARRDQ